MLRFADNPTGLAPGYAPAGKQPGRWCVERTNAGAQSASVALDLASGVGWSLPKFARHKAAGGNPGVVCGVVEPDLYAGTEVGDCHSVSGEWVSNRRG